MMAGDAPGVWYYVGVLIFLAGVIAALALYLAPLIVAIIRRRAVAAVAILNIFVGWTLIGWVGALVWAVTERTPKEQADWERARAEAAAQRHRPAPSA